MRKLIILVLFPFLVLMAAETIIIDSVTIIIPVEDKFELNVGVIVTESIPPNPEDLPRFIYDYTLINSENSGQPVWRFKIPWYPSPPAVPFEIEKIDTVLSPQGCELYNQGRPSWYIKNNLHPGDTILNFIFKTVQLPYPSDWYATGSDTIFFAEIYGPPYVGESEWVTDTLNKLYHKKTPYGPGRAGKTVGPGPEVPFPPIAAAESLEVLLDRCFELGWITDTHSRDHLWRILKRVKRHLQAGRIPQAKKANEQFRGWVEKKRGDTVSDEAYYVLYYRSKYLFSGTGGGQE